MKMNHYWAFDKSLNVVKTFRWAGDCFRFLKKNPGLSWVNVTHPKDANHGLPMANKLAVPSGVKLGN